MRGPPGRDPERRRHATEEEGHPGEGGLRTRPRRAYRISFVHPSMRHPSDRTVIAARVTPAIHRTNRRRGAPASIRRRRSAARSSAGTSTTTDARARSQRRRRDGSSPGAIIPRSPPLRRRHVRTQRNQAAGVGEALGRPGGEVVAVPGEPVEAAPGAPVVVGPVLGFPRRHQVALRLQAAQNGVDRAAGEARQLHDVESAPVPGGDGPQHEAGGVGPSWWHGVWSRRARRRGGSTDGRCVVRYIG